MTDADKVAAQIARQLEGFPILRQLAAHNLGTAGLAELVALLKLAQLQPEERGFLRALIQAPRDPAPCLILADWLEEKNRPKEAARMRAIHPQPGDAVVITAHHNPWSKPEDMEQLVQLLEEWYPGCHVILWRDRHAAIEAYPIRPGQLVVLTLPGTLTDLEHEALWEQMCRLFPANDVLVLDGGKRLETATEEQMERHGWVRKPATE